MAEKNDGQFEGAVIPPLLDKAWKYFLFGFFVIAAPIFNFTLIEVLKPEWQDGFVSSYIDLFLLPEASLWFFLLLAYAVASYIFLLWNTDRYSRSFFIRLGIHTGTFLALQYSLLTLFALEGPPSTRFIILAVFIVPLLFTRFHHWLVSKWRESLVNSILIGVGIAALITGMIFMENPMTPFVLLLMFAGVSAPFWSSSLLCKPRAGY